MFSLVGILGTSGLGDSISSDPQRPVPGVGVRVGEESGYTEACSRSK